MVEQQDRGNDRPEHERLDVLYGEYHVLVTRQCNYAVSTVMARHIERQLDRWPRPRWITFVDLSGSRIRLRAALIEGLEHSTSTSRELWRRFREEREREEPPAS